MTCVCGHLKQDHRDATACEVPRCPCAQYKRLNPRRDRKLR